MQGRVRCVPMKTLLKLALAGALSAVLVKWARQWRADAGAQLPTLNPAPDAGLKATEPLRNGEPGVTQRVPH